MRRRSRSRSNARDDGGKSLYVSGLAARVVDEDLLDHFSKEGKVPPTFCLNFRTLSQQAQTRLYHTGRVLKASSSTCRSARRVWCLTRAHVTPAALALSTLRTRGCDLF